VEEADNSLPVGTSVFKGSQAGVTDDPGILELDRSYYWRIGEVGSGRTIKGKTWSFGQPSSQ